MKDTLKEKGLGERVTEEEKYFHSDELPSYLDMDDFSEFLSVQGRFWKNWRT